MSNFNFYRVAVALEAALGTAETLDATDAAFLAFNIQAPTHNATSIPREAGGSFSELAAVSGPRDSEMEFSVYLHGKGTSGSPTWASVILPTCGMYDDSNTFKFKSTSPAASAGNIRTATVGGYIERVRYQMAGALANLRLMFEYGNQPYATVSYKGKYSAFADVAMITPTLPTEPIIRASNMTLNWDSWTFQTGSVEIDFQNEITLLEDMSSTGGDAGYAYAVIVKRRPIIKANVTFPLVASKDIMTAMHASTVGAFNLDVGEGGSSWNNIRIDAPAAQITSISPNDKNGILSAEIEWLCTRSAADDDELTIAFTDTLT